jgi:hypothetical protein
MVTLAKLLIALCYRDWATDSTRSVLQHWRYFMKLERLDNSMTVIKKISDTADVEQILITKVYVPFAGRSAWHWTQFDYFSGVLTTSLDSAKNHAEANRVQGSSWNIQEIPALVISAKGESIIFCDVKTSSPFLNWQPPIFHRKSLQSIVEAWNSEQLADDEWTFISHVSDGSILEPANQPFEKYQAISNGGNYRLGWSSSEYAIGSRRAKPIELQHIYKFAGLLSTNIEAMLKKG